MDQPLDAAVQYAEDIDTDVPQQDTVLIVFSFLDPMSNSGWIRGMVRGLRDNSADQAANRVVVMDSPSGRGLGDYAPFAEMNNWTIRNGVVTTVDFVAYGSERKGAGNFSLVISYRTGETTLLAGLSDDPHCVNTTLCHEPERAFLVAPTPAQFR